MLRLLGAFVLAVIIAAGVRWFIENARLKQLDGPGEARPRRRKSGAKKHV